jgi:hypothetical protein
MNTQRHKRVSRRTLKFMRLKTDWLAKFRGKDMSASKLPNGSQQGLMGTYESKEYYTDIALPNFLRMP